MSPRRWLPAIALAVASALASAVTLFGVVFRDPATGKLVLIEAAEQQ
jgi:hypothetical protein